MIEWNSWNPGVQRTQRRMISESISSVSDGIIFRARDLYELANIIQKGSQIEVTKGGAKDGSELSEQRERSPRRWSQIEEVGILVDSQSALD